MSQREVYQALNRKKEWLTSNEIHDVIQDFSRESICNSLRRLINSGDIEVKKKESKGNEYLYRVK